VDEVSKMAQGKYGTALITGASSGIGAAFARKLAAQGNDLVLVARRQDRLEELDRLLSQQYSIKVEVLPADLSEGMGMDKVASRIQEIGNLGLLINNAGFGAKSTFINLPYQEHEQMLQVHINAVLRLTHAALPGMIARRSGGIINVSSISAFIPVGSGSTYSSSKAYLNAFSESLQFELRGKGIYIQALCPGFTRTEFHQDPSFSRMKSSIPFFLWMGAEQVAEKSLRVLGTGKVIYIPGFLNRLIVFFGRTGIIRLFAPLVASRLGR
jgi:uncharacterized protein